MTRNCSLLLVKTLIFSFRLCKEDNNKGEKEHNNNKMMDICMSLLKKKMPLKE